MAFLPNVDFRSLSVNTDLVFFKGCPFYQLHFPHLWVSCVHSQVFIQLLPDRAAVALRIHMQVDSWRMSFPQNKIFNIGISSVCPPACGPAPAESCNCSVFSLSDRGVAEGKYSI